MIRAAVGAGETWTRPPPLLREFWHFRQYGLPPNAGGLRDQPLGWLVAGEALDYCWQCWQAWERGDKSARWRKRNQDIWPTVRWLKGLIYG